MRTIAIISLLLVGAAFLGAGCSQAQQPAQPQATATTVVLTQASLSQPATTVQTPISQASVSANTITIRNFVFNPQAITVKVGSIVRWENLDTVTHRIMFADKTVAGSDALSYSQSYSKKFDRAGTFPYYCSIHPEMTGTITVE